MTSSAASSDTQKVLDSIRNVVRALRLSTRAAEKEYGLSSAQLFVLTQLKDVDGISINELAERTLTHQSTVSVLVRKLAESKLISRRTDKDDSRKSAVFLTPSGRNLIECAPEAAQQRLVEALERLPATARAKLAALLGEVVENAGFSLPKPPMFFEEEDQTEQ